MSGGFGTAIRVKVQNFKTSSAQSLSQNEVSFLSRTFFRSCVLFFAFGFLCWYSCVLLDLFPLGKLLGCAILVVLTVLLWIPSIFFGYRYRKNPLESSSALANVSYFSLFFNYLCFFVCGITVLQSLVEGDQGDFKIFSGSLLLVSFGAAILFYMIPAIIAFRISKSKTVFSLYRFIMFCIVSYVVIFLMVMVSTLLGFNLGAISGLSVIAVVLFVMIFFLSPIVTIYRMRTVVSCINYDNAVEKSKWEKYFVFEIVSQLLHYALVIFRVAFQVIFCSRR